MRVVQCIHKAFFWSYMLGQFNLNLGDLYISSMENYGGHYPSAHQESKKKKGQQLYIFSYSVWTCCSRWCKVLITRIVWISQAQTWFKHAQEWLLHAKCNFHPHSVILHAECDFHTRTSVILTRLRVNMALKSVIITRSSVIYTRIGQFQTQNVIYVLRV
jgi:hypothetical protein